MQRAGLKFLRVTLLRERFRGDDIYELQLLILGFPGLGEGFQGLVSSRPS